MCRATVLALDIGGTKIAAGLVDANGQLLHQNRQPTPRTDDPEQVWAAAERTIADALDGRRRDGQRGGDLLGRPDPPARRNRQPGQHPCLARLPDPRPGRRRWCPAFRCGWPVTGCAWRWESTGAAPGRGARFMLGMVVSTGIGGGLVLDGVPYDGRTGNAGHVGHMVVDVDGPPCSCGGRGCVEAIASGPHMAAWAREQGWSGSRRQGTGRRRRRRERHRGAGLPARSPRRRGDDRLGRRGVRPRPRRHRRGSGQFGPVLFDPLREALRDYAGAGLHRGLRVLPGGARRRRRPRRRRRTAPLISAASARKRPHSGRQTGKFARPRRRIGARSWQSGCPG